MMKEYQAARKKLESRRLAYDASISKQQKAKRDDFRLEEELRTAKVKYEESSEDVLRRMQDIKDAEPDSVRDLTRFLDAELDFHERCVEELRRARRAWTASGDSAPASRSGSVAGLERRPTGRSRSNTGHSYTDHYGERSNGYIEEEDAPRYADNIRAPIRSSSRLSISSASGTQSPAGPDLPSRPALGSRSATFQGPTSLADRRSTMPAAPTPLSPLASVGALRGNLRPVNRIVTTRTSREDVFADRNDDDTASADSQGESPGWGGDRAPDGRSASPATSYGSALSRTNTNTSVAPTTTRKPPPPPPPSRATKPPPPPVPAKRNAVGY